jgi:NAD(P)H dehydrogenase (quinone)
MVSICPSRPDVGGPGVDDRSVTMGDRTLIIAANGRVASRVAAQLNAIGEAPDVLVRDAAKARRVLVHEHGRPAYRDLFVGELANDETMRRAMSKADVAFLAVGSSPAQADLERQVIDAAQQTSLRHLVKLSAALAAHDAVSSVLRMHAEIEDYLVMSQVPHTLVSPTSFMELALIDAASIREDDRWVGTAPDGVNSLIDSDDVVDVVVQVLRDPSKRGGTHLLTGPEALTWTEVASAMSVVTGRTITYNAISTSARRDQLESAGLAEWRVDLLLGIDELNRHSVYATPNDRVRELAGRPPRRIEEFLRRHQTAITPSPEDDSAG